MKKINSPDQLDVEISLSDFYSPIIMNINYSVDGRLDIGCSPNVQIVFENKDNFTYNEYLESLTSLIGIRKLINSMLGNKIEDYLEMYNNSMKDFDNVVEFKRIK